MSARHICMSLLLALNAWSAHAQSNWFALQSGSGKLSLSPDSDEFFQTMGAIITTNGAAPPATIDLFPDPTTTHANLPLTVIDQTVAGNTITGWQTSGWQIQTQPRSGVTSQAGNLTLRNLVVDLADRVIRADVSTPQDGSASAVSIWRFDASSIQPTAWRSGSLAEMHGDWGTLRGSITISSLALTTSGSNWFKKGLALRSTGAMWLDVMGPNFGALTLDIALTNYEWGWTPSVIPEISTTSQMLMGLIGVALTYRARRASVGRATIA